MREPNVLLIYADGMRYNDIAALGNPEIITPHLDRLVRRGTTLQNAHIMGSACPAVCIPSRCMLMTGRELFGLSGIGREIADDHITLPEYLRSTGYETFHTGVWHLSRSGFNRSFSSGSSIRGLGIRSRLSDSEVRKQPPPKGGWYEGCNGHWHHVVCDFDPSGEYPPERAYFVDPPVEEFRLPFTITEPRPGCEHSSETFSNAAIDFLQHHRRTSDRPFFLHLPFVAVHDPLQAPQRCFDLYRQPLSPYLNYAPEHPFDNGEYHIRDESLLPWPRTRAMVLKRKRELYACITHMDEQIGRVLDTLDRCGYADNTIIVFTADHGCAHGQHGLCGKQSLHDHSIRVPLVFTGPGIQASAINQGLCYLTDLFPTLCELLDISPPGSVQGRSFAACLQDSQAPGRPWLYLAYTSVQRAIRRGDWKLIEYVVREKRFQQLFNLEMDPWEIDNCIDDPMQATLREELCALLEEGRTQFNDHRPEHGERYWRSRASATWGTCEPGSFRDQKPIHQHLWAQAAEEC